MESIILKTDQPSVKTQMTATKKEQNVEKPIKKKQNEKFKTQTPKLVPNKTLKNNHCKEAGNMMTDCPKLVIRRKLEEDPDAEKCQNCSTPGHEVENSYFGANMENRPSKWNLTEAQKKVIEAYKQARKPIKPKKERPRLDNRKANINNTKPQDDWQRHMETINIKLK